MGEYSGYGNLMFRIVVWFAIVAAVVVLGVGFLIGRI